MINIRYFLSNRCLIREELGAQLAEQTSEKPLHPLLYIMRILEANTNVFQVVCVDTLREVVDRVVWEDQWQKRPSRIPKVQNSPWYLKEVDEDICMGAVVIMAAFLIAIIVRACIL
jgi:hypothetical protein